MKKISLLFLLCSFLFSHDFWIDYSEPFPKEGEKIKIFIKGGHSFPESEIGIKERLIGEFCILTPSGKEVSLTPLRKKNLTLAEFTPSEKGTYSVYFLLQKPDGEIFYIGKSCFYVEEKTEIKSLNLPLEIVVENMHFEKDEEIKVRFFLEGKEIKATLEYMNEKGHGFIRAKSGKPGSYKIKEGINLLKGEKGGRVCTFTFYGR